jgi:hypothetical protein
MRVFLLFSLSTVLASPALGQDDSFLACRKVGDATARLACYDALPMPTAAKPPAVVAMVAAAAPVKPAAPAAPVGAAPSRLADNFGLPVAARPDEAQAVVSSVGPTFSGWGPNQRIRLENGQVWQVIDGSSTSLPERARKVTVKRGALSSFYLDIEGLNTSPRVRRLE